jgi:hypothetical protein
MKKTSGLIEFQTNERKAAHVHAEFQLSTCYPDPLRQNFDLFSRKFQSFSGKLFREFQKIPNLNNRFYF